MKVESRLRERILLNSVNNEVANQTIVMGQRRAPLSQRYDPVSMCSMYSMKLALSPTFNLARCMLVEELQQYLSWGDPRIFPHLPLLDT